MTLPMVLPDRLPKHPINPAVDNAICRIVQSIGYAFDPYPDGPTFLDNDAVTLDEKHPPHHLVNIYGWLLDNVRIIPRWPYHPEDPMVSEKLGCRTIWRRVLTLATLNFHHRPNIRLVSLTWTGLRWGGGYSCCGAAQSRSYYLNIECFRFGQGLAFSLIIRHSHARGSTRESRSLH
ncbi:hypothetical protein BDY19DRAFT_705123 [Irpex rosettiformis]|uniref:Uncharacterized protein n=1 Tax=Irpex rosettiformis TaxID=378272 RepID=A0ACB8TMW1_9APHY|nr:hypothetical protein BDY19DRAFT_705123 [Irpex rosettiformis]